MEHFTTIMRSRVFNNIDVGVPSANIHGSIARERDCLENMPILEKDMGHVVDERRRLKMEGGDAKAFVKYFDHMQMDNNKFFHSFRVDDKGTLKDVFWDDARSRAAYEEFGDVVCFYSTYLTNKYHLVGVNHHGQTVLFGCALLSVEDVDMFEWVFRYADLKEENLEVVYGSFTKEEFDIRWEEVTIDYGVVNDEWLSGLFVKRSMWVPVYMKDQFWVKMRTTQRVESINSFFDKFVTRKTRLCEFGEKYVAIVNRRIVQEKEADEEGMKYTRNLLTGIPLEKYFQRIYIDAKFRAFQREREWVMYCYVEGIRNGDCILKRISDEVRAYNVSNEEEVGGKTRLADNDSVQSPPAMCTSTQRTTVSVTSPREETHGRRPSSEKGFADLVG
ncbi:Protein FAR-RED IMPAIRED RESPONSE 1 [Bienertia sinuspersici]